MQTPEAMFVQVAIFCRETPRRRANVPLPTGSSVSDHYPTHFLHTHTPRLSTSYPHGRLSVWASQNQGELPPAWAVGTSESSPGKCRRFQAAMSKSVSKILCTLMEVGCCGDQLMLLLTICTNPCLCPERNRRGNCQQLAWSADSYVV